MSSRPGDISVATPIRLPCELCSENGLQGDGPPFVKIGGAVRYRRSDLDQYIAQRRRLSTSDDGRAA